LPYALTFLFKFTFYILKIYIIIYISGIIYFLISKSIHIFSYFEYDMEELYLNVIEVHIDVTKKFDELSHG